MRGSTYETGCFGCLLITLIAFSAGGELLSAGSAQTKSPRHGCALKSGAGKVAFSHSQPHHKELQHRGHRPVTCIECHHVEQPVDEAKKMPHHQTAYPPDRTTTLTAELLTKEPTTKVTPCRGCHARKDEKPTVWPELPQIKSENSTAMITLTNQQAFHRACAGCHDQVL